jgi:autotransporter-associated beta strand protein
MGTLKRRSLTSKFLFGMFAVATVCGLMTVNALAATYYLDTNGNSVGAGGTPNGTWQDSGTDWTASSAGTLATSPYTTGGTDNLYFVASAGTSSGENPYTVTVSGNQAANSLYFQSSGTATLSGGTISLGSGGITLPQYAYGTTAQGPVNITSQVALQGTQTWSNSSANTLTVGGNVVNGGNILTIAGPGSTVIAGSLSGMGGLVKSGSGLLTFQSANTFLGSTTVSGGTIDLAQGNALQWSTLIAPTSVSVVFDSSVASNAFRIGALSGSGNLTLQNNATSPAAIVLTLGGNNGSMEYFGVLSGAGSLTVAGIGTLTLANTNTYTGGTTVSAGVLQLGDGTIGHDGALSGSGGITDNAALVYNLYGAQAFAGNVSGSGSLTKAGSGLLTLTGSNSCGARRNFQLGNEIKKWSNCLSNSG